MMESRDYAHEVINFALGNQTLDKIVRRLPNQLDTYGRARSLGIFTLGGSDSVIRRGERQPQVPLNTFRRLLPKLGEILVSSRVTPMFIVGPYPIDEARCNPSPSGDRFSYERGLEYTAAVREYAEATGSPLIRPTGLLECPLEKILSFDGVHPSSEGHRIIAGAVTTAVRERLARPLLTYARPD